MKKLIKILIAAISVFAVISAHAMNKDMYTDAIDAADVERVYALLIAETPGAWAAAKDVHHRMGSLENALKDGKTSWRAAEPIKARQDKLHPVANVFRTFIARGNLQKPNDLSQAEWDFYKENMGIWMSSESEKGKITAPTYQAFKEEEERDLDRVISEATNRQGRGNQTLNERLDALVSSTKPKPLDAVQQASRDRIDQLLKTTDNILEELKQNRLKWEAQQSNILNKTEDVD